MSNGKAELDVMLASCIRKDALLGTGEALNFPIRPSKRKILRRIQVLPLDHSIVLMLTRLDSAKLCPKIRLADSDKFVEFQGPQRTARYLLLSSLHRYRQMIGSLFDLRNE